MYEVSARCILREGRVTGWRCGTCFSGLIRSRYQALLDSGLTPLIIDAGANNGASTRWFASSFARAHVTAIEPEPENCSIRRMNIRGRESISLFQAASEGCRGRLSFTAAGKKAPGR